MLTPLFSLSFATDLATALHMLCFAIGIGMSLFIEALVLPRLLATVTKDDLRILLAGHHAIRLALAGLWVTGVAIMGLKLGLQGAPLTPKLAMKFAVVGVLTFNMALIETHVLPVLKRCMGAPIAALPTRQLRHLGAVGGLSAGCWLMALGLGAIGLFKALDTVQLLEIFVPALVAAPVLGALLAPVIARRAQAMGAAQGA